MNNKKFGGKKFEYYYIGEKTGSMLTYIKRIKLNTNHNKSKTFL
ncbi:hypothetical protein SAMN05421593_4130 [Chryseobacterium culicis]|uniref:Uncharacterized protein n=1 Tax=Chryseobacterium culicis TaxID=680127 RepID=A0A1H6IDD3_CHRCI|nr:hypothetical protein SAMN05421593_4130 [Chryseobacterium culicis]